VLSYQHGYHAGNFADVLKHFILHRVVEYLKNKDKPFCVVDTHAGRGLYDLMGMQAQKNREFSTGIQIINQQHAALPTALGGYWSLVMQFNPEGIIHRYPGSPLITAQLLRPQDRLVLVEQHPEEFRCLLEAVKFDKRIKPLAGDGFQICLGLLPPKERRGLVLIDPAYELKSDYQTVVSALRDFYRRFSGGCYLLWYPVVFRHRNRMLESALKTSGIPDILLAEVGIRPDSADFGMTASGMIIVNPPWTLRNELAEVLPWLAGTLAEKGQGYCRLEQLA
jgi:23S rRNA (adenine2030-N6)-methyltransferase